MSIMFWEGIGDPDNTWILEKDLRRVLQKRPGNLWMSS